MKNVCPICGGKDIIFGVSERNLTRHVDDLVYHTECLEDGLNGTVQKATE